MRSAEFLGESDEKPFRPANVAEPIRVFILDYFAYELRTALAERQSFLQGFNSMPGLVTGNQLVCSALAMRH
jgi:hypothetical protein